MQIAVARGNLYLSLELYETYFSGVDCVALSPHPEGALIIPLIRQSAGGLLLKIRNLRGDRVIHAQEFWRQNGFAESFDERRRNTRWLSDRAALLVIDLRPTVQPDGDSEQAPPPISRPR
jgi:hypothetical protein